MGRIWCGTHQLANTLLLPDTSVAECGGPLQVPCTTIGSPIRVTGMLLMNTFGLPDAMVVGGPHGWLTVASTPTRVTGIPFAYTFGLPAPLLSPHDILSPILVMAGIVNIEHCCTYLLMIDNFVTSLGSIFQAFPFTASTWFVLGILAFFIWLFSIANKSPNSPVNWEHMIVDTSSNRTSPYKLGYLIGLIVGTWIVVTLTDQSTLTYDIFGLYLTYLLGGAGWNAFIKSKESSASKAPDEQ